MGNVVFFPLPSPYFMDRKEASQVKLLVPLESYVSIDSIYEVCLTTIT